MSEAVNTCEALNTVGSVIRNAIYEGIKDLKDNEEAILSKKIVKISKLAVL